MLIKSIYYLGVFTISFDLFLVFNIGFNIRASQIFMIIAFFLMITLHNIKSVRWPLAFNALLLWCFFIILFIPNTAYPIRNIGYALWLFFNILLIITTVTLFNSFDNIKSLMRIYMYSFLFVSILGLLQFMTPLHGIGSAYVSQWWIEGVLPRINVFSYEPSYFASYMIAGWIMSGYMINNRVQIVGRGILYLIFLLTTIVLILSSSRMGWLMMILWLLQYPIMFVIRFSRCRVNLHYLNCTVFIIILSIPILYLSSQLIGIEDIIFLLQGTGIAETTDHSVRERMDTFVDVWKVFSASPIIGCSLGGIPSAIANLHLDDVRTMQEAKIYEGMNIFAEVLAASGLFGFIAFLCYIFKVIFTPFRLSGNLTNPEMKHILRALAWALIAEIIILQFNQNILRPYLWLNIAVLSAAFGVARSIDQP